MDGFATEYLRYSVAGNALSFGKLLLHELDVRKEARQHQRTAAKAFVHTYIALSNSCFFFFKKSFSVFEIAHPGTCRPNLQCT